MKQRGQYAPEYAAHFISFEGVNICRIVTKDKQKKSVNRCKSITVPGGQFSPEYPKGYISQIINGNFNFTLKKLIELSLALNIAPDLKLKDLDQYIQEDKLINGDQWGQEQTGQPRLGLLG